MKISKIILGVLAVGAMTVSCEDQMEYKEYSVYDEEYISEHWNKVAGFMTRIYNNLDYDFGNYYGGASLCSATDEAMYSRAGNKIEGFYNGAWSPSNDLACIWKSAWEGISYCNLYLDEFNNLTFEDWIEDKNYTANLMRANNFQYEARATRAYFYFTLLRAYGAVPLKVNNLDADAANSLPRTSTEEIFAFIKSECDAVKDSIMRDYITDFGSLSLSDQETGRMNNLTVMAIKAQAAMYHASPLFNPDNNKQLWVEAAEAYEELLDSCAKRGLTLATDYAELFGEKGWQSKELVFARRVAKANSFEKYNFPIGMENAQGGNCPTQNLVDAYEMTNGMAITEAGSGYDPANPYAGRDKRLALTVAVNGEQWPASNPTLLQTYEGGANGLPITNATPTGYYLKKYCNGGQIIAKSGESQSNHSWMVYRLGGLYLDFAECVFNATGSCEDAKYGMSAIQAVNKVRKRAGQPELAGLTNDEFVAKYRNERFVELAFEGHRFYDLRRWKVAGDEKYRTIKVMNIKKAQDGTFTYTPGVSSVSRQWDDKMYFFPIPQADMLKSNGGWEQNPGW